MDLILGLQINSRIASQQIQAYVFAGCTPSEVREKKIAALIESME